MIRQSWTINEDERKRILNLHENATKKHYILKEATDPNKISFNISKSFPSGKFNISDTSEIDTAISQIQSLLKSGEGNFDTIVINSSESNVPNRGVGMQVGDLSKKRAAEVEKYIKGKLGGTVNVQINDLGPQGPEWDTTKGSNHPDYTNNQFVKLSLSAQKNPQPKITGGNDSICRLNIDKPGKQGLASNNYITTDRKLIDFGTITLNSESIPDRMVIYNSKNQIVKDTGYVTTRPHKYTQFKYVPEYVAGLTRLNGTPAVSGSKIITIQADNVKDLLKQLLVDPSVIPSVESFRPMGPEVYNGMRLLERLLKQGVTTFVIYEVSQGDVSIEVNASQQDTRLVVMSPLGKTGYTVKGVCPQQP